MVNILIFEVFKHKESIVETKQPGKKGYRIFFSNTHIYLIEFFS